MSAKSPTIGVFDSGMGGLTVLHALLERRVAERILYLGDTARLPYGTKSAATVTRYALTLGRHLIAQGVDFLVVACNTVSAVALDELTDALGVPLVGVVEAGARAAASAGGPIAVLGTEATVASGAYPRAIARLAPALEVRSIACPLFVPLVEEGWTGGEVPRQVAERYLGHLRGGVRTVLLGCTHYPLLSEVIAAAVVGASVVDPAAVVAEEVHARLGSPTVASTEVQFSVTDGAERFLRLGRRILKRDLGKVDLVDV